MHFSYCNKIHSMKDTSVYTPALPVCVWSYAPPVSDFGPPMLWSYPVHTRDKKRHTPCHIYP